MRQNACGISKKRRGSGCVELPGRETWYAALWNGLGTTSLLAVAALWKGCIQCPYTSSVLGRLRCQEDKSLIQDFIPRSPLTFLSVLLPKAWSALSLLLSSSLLSFTRSSSLCLLFPTPSILCKSTTVCLSSPLTPSYFFYYFSPLTFHLFPLYLYLISSLLRCTHFLTLSLSFSLLIFILLFDCMSYPSLFLVFSCPRLLTNFIPRLFSFLSSHLPQSLLFHFSNIRSIIFSIFFISSFLSRSSLLYPYYSLVYSLNLFFFLLSLLCLSLLHFIHRKWDGALYYSNHSYEP